jgi:hypothetical protein
VGILFFLPANESRGILGYGEFVPGAGGTLLVFIPAAGALFGAGVFPDSEASFWQPARASTIAMRQIVMTVFMPLLV